MDEKLLKILELQEQGMTRPEIAKALNYVRADSMTRYMKNQGYFYNTISNKFIKSEADNKVRQVSDNNQIQKIEPKGDYLEVANKQLKADILELGSRYKEINMMLEWFKINQSSISDKHPIEVIQVVEQGIRIDLPENRAIKKISALTNNQIWEEFGEFASRNAEFTKGDLLAMALKEYMEKYKG